jgi:hypothetical protein
VQHGKVVAGGVELEHRPNVRRPALGRRAVEVPG